MSSSRSHAAHNVRRRPEAHDDDDYMDDDDRRGRGGGGTGGSHVSTKVRKFVAVGSNFSALLELLGEDARGNKIEIPEAVVAEICSRGEQAKVVLDEESGENVMDAVLKLRGAYKYTMPQAIEFLSNLSDRQQRAFLKAAMADIVPYCLSNWYGTLLPEQRLAVNDVIVGDVGNDLPTADKCEILASAFDGKMLRNAVDILEHDR